MKLLKTILKFSTEKVNSYGAQYDAFWIFMLIFYITPPYTWSYWHPGPYSNLWILILRIISFFLGISIALRKFWPKNFKIYLPIFWHFTLFFWCPFRTFFILLNSAHSEGFSFYGLLGIFLFAILVDEISYTIILLISIIFTPLFFYSTGGLNVQFPNITTIFQTFWMIGTITFFKWVFFRQQRIEALGKIQCYQNVANTVAHEMRIPLASIMLAAKALKMKNNDNFKLIKIQKHIETLVSQAQTTIDMLLFRLGKHLHKNDNVECSIKDCVNTALNEYPFEGDDLNKIEIKQNGDILILSDNRIIIHVLFNLIKNSIFAIKESEKGTIVITIDSITNQLIFRDTASGIPYKDSAKLFKEFFTTKSTGTGMGLYFCKQVMTSLGGSINCFSKEGQFTEFILTFPKYVRNLSHESSIAM